MPLQIIDERRRGQKTAHGIIERRPDLLPRQGTTEDVIRWAETQAPDGILVLKDVPRNMWSAG
jgi:hypothetical protein